MGDRPTADRTGPKEWRPERWAASPLLTDEENRRVAELFLKSRGKPLTDDIRWLISILKRVDSIAPDEFVFPTFAALVNQVSEQAYALRYDRTCTDFKETKVHGNILSWVPLLDCVFSCDICEAIILIRPWVRVERPFDCATVESLRKARISMLVDGHQVLRGLLEEHLVVPGMAPFRKRPWKPVLVDRNLFPACGLTTKMQADPKDLLGFSCPNGSQIKIAIEKDDVDYLMPPTTLVTGLVAAKYTTKK